MNQSQWSRHSSGQQDPVYSQALAHLPPLLLVSTACLYTESAYHAQENIGGPGGVWWGHCTGTRFLIQVLLFSIIWPWPFPFPSWSLGFSSAKVDLMVKPRPGWGLSFLSHLSWCYVYTALLPSSWGERLVSTPYPRAGPAIDRPAEEL